MKPQKTKNKALELYVGNVPIGKICKDLKIYKTTFYEWSKKGRWEKLKEEAIKKSYEKTTNDIITLQSELGRLASEELLQRLKDKVIKDKELVSIAKHGLEVVRPRQTTNNLNITKNENMAIQVIIPKEVEELLEKEVIIE